MTTVFTALCLSALGLGATGGPAWSVRDGWLVATGFARAGVGPAANVSMRGSDALLDDGASPEVTPMEGGGWRMAYETPRGRLADTLTPYPDLGVGAWRRSLTFTNTTDSTVDIVGAVMRVNPERADEAAAWNPRPFAMVDTADGGALCMSYWSSADLYALRDNGEIFAADVHAGWRLAPGQEAVIGEQGIWRGEAQGQRAFRDEAQRWYRARGFTKPLEYPDWLRRGVLYEASAAGHIDSRFSDVGGFDAFAKQMDYLHDLGVSALWLNAPHTHKSPPNPTEGGWNHYDPLDVMQIDPVLGGVEALTRLTQALRERDIHVLSEVVPHGGHSAQGAALEPWWLRTPEGELARPWGGYGMDYASPEWQAIHRDVMAYQARAFGVEGVRIDVADGAMNWGSPRMNHASYSTLGGSIELLKALRDGLAEAAPLPVLLPESGENRPEHYAIDGAAVLGYGFPFVLALQHEVDFDIGDAPRLKRFLTDSLERENGSLPPGALSVRTLNNHDTVCDVGRPMFRFGAGLSVALYAVCASSPGVPMFYQEEEVGTYAALRRINWTRRALPVLCDGAADYGVDAPPEVFAVLRGVGDERVLCLVNLSGAAIDAQVALPEDDTIADVVDALSGEQGAVTAGAVNWQLAAYEAAWLCIGFAPELKIPAERHPLPEGAFPHPNPLPEGEGEEEGEGENASAGFTQTTGEGAGPTPSGPLACGGAEGKTPAVQRGHVRVQCTSGKWNVRQDENGMTLEVAGSADGPAVLRILNADRWCVSGRTALLEDRTLHRHRPFPESAGYAWHRHDCWGYIPHRGLYNHLSASERLWQSVLEPLHPELPAIAFTDEDGVGVMLSIETTNARNVVLQTSGDGVSLELRLFVQDPDLHPIVRACGIGQPWDGDVPEPEPEPFRATLRITFVDGNARELLAAERLPVDQGRPVVRCDAPVSEMKNHRFLIEPGRIEWSGVSAVNGTRRIQFSLRHSEAGPEGADMKDAYVVEVDGVPQPLEWTAMNTLNFGNAYIGHAMTPPIDLRNGPHTIAITTRQSWCAVGETFTLVAP